MIRFFIGLMLASLTAYADTLPDPTLTPGATRSTDARLVCATKTATVRLVTTADKIAVRKSYHYTGDPGEIDHLIPLSIGGSNSRLNLWPQSGIGPNNFHDKDKCELTIYKKVCNGTLDIKTAQSGIAKNWIEFCKGVE